MEKKDFRHLLCFDQICFDGIKYGLSDLYYCLGDSVLHIKNADHYQEKESKSKYPLPSGSANLKAVLESFLVNLMSYRWNFAGTPSYVSSEVFTEAEFDAMLKKGIAVMDERDLRTIKSGYNNELIKYCQAAGLNPEPEGGGAHNWTANCPSGGHHQIMISTKSNQWGCGYCKKKGGLPELRVFNSNKKP